MGQRTDETVRQIEDATDRLGSEIGELEERLQGRVATGRRTLLPIAAAIAGTGATWLVVRGLRNRTAARRKTLIGRVLPKGVAKSVSRTFEGNAWKFLAAGVGGVWVAFRVAELQQLRRLNRTLAVR
jgi:hypothetical protein